MKNSLLFRAKTIGLSRRDGRKPSTLVQAARHNLREIQAESGAHEHIALNLSYRNVVLHGPTNSRAIVELTGALKEEYVGLKRKLRVDHVQALEFVISLHNDADIDQMEYFRASTRWLIKTFGSRMLLSAVVHLDEEAPHMHALVLPIVAGRYEGGSPIKRAGLHRLKDAFAQEVGEPFGLSFERKERLTAKQRAVAYSLVVDHLLASSDSVIKSHVWKVVLQSIKREPQEFLECLGLMLPRVRRTRKQKTVAEIFTSTGRKTSEDRKRHSERHLSSVGFRDFSDVHSVEGFTHAEA